MLNYHVFVTSYENPDQFEYVTLQGLIVFCWDLKVLSFERDSGVHTWLNKPKDTPSSE